VRCGPPARASWGRRVHCVSSHRDGRVRRGRRSPYTSFRIDGLQLARGVPLSRVGWRAPDARSRPALGGYDAETRVFGAWIHSDRGARVWQVEVALDGCQRRPQARPAVGDAIAGDSDQPGRNLAAQPSGDGDQAEEGPQRPAHDPERPPDASSISDAGRRGEREDRAAAGASNGVDGIAHAGGDTEQRCTAARPAVAFAGAELPRDGSNSRERIGHGRSHPRRNLRCRNSRRSGGRRRPLRSAPSAADWKAWGRAAADRNTASDLPDRATAVLRKREEQTVEIGALEGALLFSATVEQQLLAVSGRFRAWS